MRIRPVCVRCQVGYQIAKSGVYLIEMFNDPPEPYKLWNADLWQCPICNHQIVRGFGNEAVQHFQADLNEIVGKLNAAGETVIYEYELNRIPEAV